jgi:hypothetical protein
VYGVDFIIWSEKVKILLKGAKIFEKILAYYLISFAN